MTNHNRHAWVVFSGTTDLPWLKILKPGFRHCFAVLREEDHWIVIDPLSHFIDVKTHVSDANFDMVEWLKTQGMTVLKTKITPPNKQAPLMPFSCVEVVKRVIGIHARGVITPWQLFQFLLKHNKGDPQWEA